MNSGFHLYQKGDLRYLPVLAAMVIVASFLFVRDVLPEKPAGDDWIPAVAEFGRPETILVFVGSSSCVNSTDPRLSEAVRRLRTRLREQAEEQGRTFSSIGVSLDWRVSVGTKYLESLGPFDEVLIGRSWLNSGALKYIWGDQLGGPAAVPQLLVVERFLDQPASNVIHVASERVLYRMSGVTDIVALSGNGGGR